MRIVPSEDGRYDYRLAPLTRHLFRTLTNDEVRWLNRVSPGYPVRNPRIDCQTCGGEGHFRTRLQGEGVVTCECSCMEQWMLARILLESGIGDTYQRYSWDSVAGVSAEILGKMLDYKANLDYNASVGLGMIMHGAQTGTGKTLLSTLMAKAAMANGHSVYFTTFGNLLTHYTDSWSDADMRKWFVNRVKFSKFLYVDDLGKENPSRSGVVDELLDAMIRPRVAYGLPTNLSTNLSPTRDKDGVGSDFSRYQGGLLDLLSERSVMVDMTSGGNYRDTVRGRLDQDREDRVRYPVVVG